MLIDILIAALVLLGAAFALIGSIGLVLLPDFFCRLHGPTKATTLGVGSMLAASALYFAANGPTPAPKELLVALFLFMTAPVSANLLAKSALHLRLRSLAEVPARFQHRSAPDD
ncbi:MAG: Na+/H+ antiporter subunit G [Gammaproteobacteria bacterium]|jgi:multicomponent K+:H+ antiporter subunit G|nr:Na+/H+ antiporter subunit G [Gammaproteobacteria bacterium]